MVSQDIGCRLQEALCALPKQFNNRYTTRAHHKLLDVLFRCLTNDRSDYLSDLFPKDIPPSYSLREAQGILDETEYTEAARGHPCGHIMRPGEAQYRCQTCTDDPTAIFCARCWTSSDHEGHQFSLSLSSGNGGCCDCGDPEAWKRPVICDIHTAREGLNADTAQPQLPDDLTHAVRTTVARAIDYFCDIISCSPENLRSPKTFESVQQDEMRSRLNTDVYTEQGTQELSPEYSLVVWNDEKHTMEEVQAQVARACRERRQFGLIKAEEANDIGRSVVCHSRDLKELLRRAEIIEQIKVTVTVRSARDTFREQMCGTILEWLGDIAGCAIRGNGSFLYQTVCEELLQVWQVGSQATNARIGRQDLDDNSEEDGIMPMQFSPDMIRILLNRNAQPPLEADDDGMEDGNELADPSDDDDDDDENEEDDDDDDYEQIDSQMADNPTEQNDAHELRGHPDVVSDLDEMDTDGDNDFLDAAERMDADDSAPLPPPPTRGDQPMEPEPAIALANDELSRHPSMTLGRADNPNFRNIPRTPGVNSTANRTRNHEGLAHWRIVGTAKGKATEGSMPAWEDLRKNIRLDALILFDLRLWKKLRIELRSLLISTVNKVPQFKRILGLRFAGLYTTLAQLYLIADREPEHTILHLSVQILTTPSIAEEVTQKGNFLTKLLAILYTFLTTRQVGFPEEVDPDATLGFDAGSVANRRLHHFFSDLRYFLATPSIRDRIRVEKQYLLQYLDLAKLSQGICPNVRATGEHVEYEADTWISASILTREINRLCHELTEAYQGSANASGIDEHLGDAIKQTSITTLLVCSGMDYQRFEQSEIKELIKFHYIGPFPGIERQFKTVDFVVEKGTLSFHHPLHYTLSWLIESGKDSFQVIKVLQATAEELVTRFNASGQINRRIKLHTLYSTGEDALLGLFDYPLRVCAWLAQMRANMWVRNGMSLKHQMTQYKNVTHRDLGYHRDLFLLQCGLVACDPERFLGSMIDRFGLTSWVAGRFEAMVDADGSKLVEIAEDFVYLLINMLSDRDSLTTSAHNSESQVAVLRKDIAHILCFKPLSFSDLTQRLTERAQDREDLPEILRSMTNFRGPEALNDSGLFELKPEYIAELDPYNSHFNKNQRDEAENIYKNWIAKKSGKQPEDIVLEPKLTAITCEAFHGLCAVIHTPLFATMLYSMLSHATVKHDTSSIISSSRAESFLQVVLHLTLIATIEDQSVEDETTRTQSLFIKNALTQCAGLQGQTIVVALHKIWLNEEFSTCRSKVRHILRLFHRQWPQIFTESTRDLDFPAARLDAASPANLDVDVEAKKKQAMERKARIMAQMQQQQQSFMNNQGMTNWDDDEMSEQEPELPVSTESRHWKLPSGVCIQCREETNDHRFYGTFAMITDGHLLRQTPKDNVNCVQEVLACPDNLDVSNEDARPFGVAGANLEYVTRHTLEGEKVISRRTLSKGWPQNSTLKEPTSTSCGHIMHFSCFENYFESVKRRHVLQIARLQSERVSLNEFVCPLCKALSNAFLPILYKSTEQAYPASLETQSTYEMFTEETLPAMKRSLDVLSAETKLSAHLIRIEKPIHFNTVTNFSANAMLALSKSLTTFAEPLTTFSELPGAYALADLSKIYERLRTTLDIVRGSTTRADISASEGVSILLQVVTNSVATVEIGHRGRDSHGICLLDGIPSQTLSHLQVIGSTLASYGSTMSMVDTGKGEDVDFPYHNLVLKICQKLFARQYGETDPGKDHETLLMTDGFAAFVEQSFILTNMQGLPIVHILRLCLIQEILRVAIWWLRIRKTYPSEPTTPKSPNTPRSAVFSRDESKAMGGFVFWLMDLLRTKTSSSLLDFNEVEPLYRAIRTYALTFMRKAVILLHTLHHVDFPSVPAMAGKPELDRLLSLCKLPDLPTLLFDFSEQNEATKGADLVRQWILDYGTCTYTDSNMAEDPLDTSEKANSKPEIALSHPTPFELIGLPEYYDTLIEECQRRRCPTTGEHISDPALCLFCGAIFCAQAWCCMKDKRRGGCNHHIETCSAPIGAYLFIRKCNIVFLDVRKDAKRDARLRDAAARNEAQPQELILQDGRRVAINEGIEALMGDTHGSYFPAPYLTKYGELDQGLRTKERLILNQKRYDRLVRDVWLCVNGNIWSAIARKLEPDVNAGGWETM